MLSNILNNLGMQNFDVMEILIRVFVIMMSLSIHEAAHAFRAYKLGDDTAERAGRLSLNPLVHLDPLGTLMMFIARVGWAKPVPINPLLFTRAKSMKRGIIEVSIAGPLSNLILSFGSYLIYSIVRVVTLKSTGGLPDDGIMSIIFQILHTMFLLNIFLAVFNLLPVPPLDGFKIFGAFLPSRIYYKLMEYERYIGIAFILIIVFGGSLFSTILTTLATPFYLLITWPLDSLSMLLLRVF